MFGVHDMLAESFTYKGRLPLKTRQDGGRAAQREEPKTTFFGSDPRIPARTAG